MSVLAQSLFSLVSRHFMSFSLFSAWHNFKVLVIIYEVDSFFCFPWSDLLNHVIESLRRLE
jgi:hypothetical protein